jgi:hypothetical protein
VLYVPGGSGARTEVLHQHHNDPLAGPFGLRRTLDLVARKYYWLGLSRNVKAYCKANLMCRQVRPVRHRLHGSLEPLLQQRAQWIDIFMDFIVGLPVRNFPLIGFLPFVTSFILLLFCTLHESRLCPVSVSGFLAASHVLLRYRFLFPVLVSRVQLAVQLAPTALAPTRPTWLEAGSSCCLGHGTFMSFSYIFLYLVLSCPHATKR